LGAFVLLARVQPYSLPSLPPLRWFDILVKGGNMAAWPINPFFAKTSEESPLELGSPYCSDPDCEYWKELREIEEKCKGQLAAKRRVGADSAAGV
jgi:hypothetical protein